MNDPKRWSSAGSEVDPVIRSLIGYAKSRAPSTVEVERLVTSVTARQVRPWPRTVRWRARLHAAASLAAAVACGGLAWAGFGQVLDAIFPTAPAASVRATATPSAVAPPVRAVRRSASPVPEAVAEAPSSSPIPSSPHRAAPAALVTPPKSGDTPRALASSPASMSSADDIATLAEARRLLASEPARALELTEASARDNPRSPFAEERSAIGIEALARLGRSSEAELRLAAFERSYPESLYRRRLRAELGGR